MKKKHSNSGYKLYADIFKLKRSLSALLSQRRTNFSLNKALPNILNEIDSDEYILVALSIIVTYHKICWRYTNIAAKIGSNILYNILQVVDMLKSLIHIMISDYITTILILRIS